MTMPVKNRPRGAEPRSRIARILKNEVLYGVVYAAMALSGAVLVFIGATAMFR
jgi:hypothetical protein